MKKKALVIDDEADICQLLVAYLRKNNFKTHAASNLADGIKLCSDFLPDIIFLDNNLPDGSGMEAIADFHSIVPNSKVIMISAITNLSEKAIESGAFGFVGKPISYKSIDNFLERSAENSN